MKKDHKDIDQRKLVLYLLDEISQTGRADVEAWLEVSQENRDEYDLLKKTWQETGTFEFFPREIDVESTWSQFSKKLEEEPFEEKTVSLDRAGKGRQRYLRIVYAAAAILILVLVSVTTILNIQREGRQEISIAAVEEQVIKDTLIDGSELILNENSTVVLAKNFNRKERKVELRGEAFFKVKPDEEKTFIIEAGPGEVKVLGTSFQVKNFPETDLEVFVEEGTVELSLTDPGADGNSLILTKGERGLIKYPSGELVKAEMIQPDDLFWANKKLIFDETRLSLVFELLRKHYDSEIVVENEGINSCLLSATFEDEEIDQILNVIGVSFGLTIEKDQDKFIIKGEGCDNE